MKDLMVLRGAYVRSPNGRLGEIVSGNQRWIRFAWKTEEGVQEESFERSDLDVLSEIEILTASSGWVPVADLVGVTEAKKDKADKDDKDDQEDDADEGDDEYDCECGEDDEEECDCKEHTEYDETLDSLQEILDYLSEKKGDAHHGGSEMNPGKPGDESGPMKKHNPFRRAKSIGKGPLKGSNKQTKRYSCSSGGKYKQICKFMCKKNGKKATCTKVVHTNRVNRSMDKKSYNHMYYTWRADQFMKGRGKG